MAKTSEVFSTYQKYINSDQDLREEIKTLVKEIDQIAREMCTLIQAVHQDTSKPAITDVCNNLKKLFPNVEGGFSKLKSVVPSEQYYRYHDHWRFLVQKLVFVTAMVTFLEDRKLVTRDISCDYLGVQIKAERGFHLDLEDFLMGLLQMSTEMSRLAINSVTCGDYELPFEISRFINEMHSGFRLLNLKNDALRRRFDGLKYDVKKIEEVVYDLSIRGLKSVPGSSVSSGRMEVSGEKEIPLDKEQSISSISVSTLSS